MQKLMAIFAHPDDEGAMSGTLARYAQQGVDVTLVCATRGEVGEISDPALATRETLGAVRTKELEAACATLGIQRLEWLGYRDSGMVGTAENEDPRALVQAEETAVLAQLVGLMRQLQPDVVVTFEPFGWYGHPDHVAVSRWVTQALQLVGDASAYPEQGASWQPHGFFHSVIPFSQFGQMMEAAVAGGYIEPSDGFTLDLPVEELMKTETAVTHVIDVAAFYETKQAAMMAHQTQFGADSLFRKIPKAFLEKMWGEEHFIQIYPQPAANLAQNRLADLLLTG